MRPLKRNVELVVILLTAFAELGSGISELRHMVLAFSFGYWLSEEHG